MVEKSEMAQFTECTDALVEVVEAVGVKFPSIWLTTQSFELFNPSEVKMRQITLSEGHYV